MKHIYLFLSFFLSIFSFADAKNNNVRNSIPALQKAKMQFVENKGQVIDMKGQLRPDILYIGDQAGTKVYLRKGGVSYVMMTEEANGNSAMEQLDNSVNSLNQSRASTSLQFQRIDMEFVNGNPNCEVQFFEQAEGYSNYYLAHCPEGITDVHSYNKIVYKNIYDNIDVVYYGEKKEGLKYDIIVNPGGDFRNVKLKYTGADGIQIQDSKLKIKNSLGEIVEQMPKVYQNINGKITDVKAEYSLDGTTINFKLKTYNLRFPLIIDPWITYYGGSSSEQGRGITTDGSGNVIATGYSTSANFPVTPGAFQSFLKNGPNADPFVIKFDSNGNRLWATYFGGTSTDNGNDVDVDSFDNIIATGITYSTDFPVSLGAFQSTNAGMSDGYIMTFDSGGNRIWGTYFGGSLTDLLDGASIDNGDNIVITGMAGSAVFPVTAGSYQSGFSGGCDGYLAKFNSLGNRLWATFFGGLGFDYGRNVTVDPSTDIIVASETSSSGLQIGPGAFQPNYGGTGGLQDAYVIKFDSDGNYKWATYYGGTGDDKAWGIDTDSYGNVVFTGSTGSGNFPVSGGAFQNILKGPSDAYIVKLDPNGARLWATFLGGSTSTGITPGKEEGCAVAVDSKDNIILGGDTYSNNFPVTSCAFRTSAGGGGEDNYIVQFDPNGNLICSGYVGGSGHDEAVWGNMLTLKGSFLYFVGSSPGSYPVTSGGFQTLHGGGVGDDAVVAQLCINTCGYNTQSAVNFSSDKTNVCTAEQVSFLGQISVCDMSNTSWLWTFTGGTPSISTLQNPSLVYNSTGTYTVKMKVSTPCGGVDSVEITNYITVGNISASITGNNSVCAGSGVLLSASAGNNFRWSTGETTTFITVFPTANTVYTLSVSSGNCTASAVKSITVSVIPSVNVADNSPVCEGKTITLSASGGVFYSWGGANGFNSTVQNPFIGNASVFNNGIYTVTVTDANNCINTATLIITVNPLPSVTAVNNSPVCVGDSIIFSASGGAGYLWSGPSFSALTATVTISNANLSNAGVYTVTVTDNNNCINTATLLVTVNALPSANAGNDTTICEGSVVILQASGGGTYLWTSGHSNQTYVVSPNISTSYTVIVSNVFCTDEDEVTITVLPAPIASASGNANISHGGSIILSAGGGGTYLWHPYNGLDCNTCLNPTAKPLITTIYCVEVTNTNGCKDTACVTVKVDTICEDIFIPTAFSPNEDAQNEVLCIYGINCIKSFTLSIYSRWGEKVFETTDPEKCWNGKHAETLINTGVYVYFLNGNLINGESIRKIGNISLIR